ncbi:NAD(P)/FAD-dependent oxidoreductase [Paenibacillus qinlingensis]|uniref:NAD(P)/FAD-dependent oxidoreductase n=1 Tax=Paenibacillus qinlingensis TaxID=1837343 RepID=UPI001563B8BA|nr:NAD(P)/FAD-dependent oxidoreductase [Paenibacillus qinlingensis]NQX60805.1 NAD(P)/FAD-dependent oxidoreductase [Paenibacillus qinlingensis]
MTHIYDAAVVGAGIAGSVMAKSLADHGWDTVLFDRKAFPRHKVCGEFLSPESLTMLKKLGLREAVSALKPSRIHQTSLMLSRGKQLEIALPGTAWGVSRYQLDATLHQSALRAGVQVQTETTVISVKPGEQGYIMTTKQHGVVQEYHVRAVIAACGATAIPGLQSQTSREAMPNKGVHLGVKSHYKGLNMDGVVELYFFEGGYLGLSPIEDGLVNVAALLEREAFQQVDKSILGLIEAASAKHSKLWERLSSAQPIAGTQAAVAPVKLTRKPLAWDMFPRLGDAAMMLPPLCGDGMSMAIRSAMLCAPFASRYLKGQISLVEWERDYSGAIHREFKGPLKWGHRLQGMLTIPYLPSVMLAAAKFTPGLAERFVQATRLKEIEY